MSNRKIHGCIDKGLYFKSRKDAEQFIEEMSEISDTYGFIFCADVLDYFGEDCKISHICYGWFDVRKWFVHHVGSYTPYIDHPYRVQLDRPVYYSDESKNKPTDIHGGFVTIGPEMPWNENKFKKIYDEWIKENPHTDIPSLYPKTHFVFPISQQKLKPKIKNVIFNDPATIVFWSDGTKTVVKTQDNEMGDHEIYDPEKGLAMAISKKALGNEREYYHTFLHWLKKYEPKKYICMYCGVDTTNPAWGHACDECEEALED